VHQPDLLLLDGLLDGLAPRDQASLADAVRDLARDTAIVAVGGTRRHWPWSATSC